MDDAQIYLTQSTKPGKCHSRFNKYGFVLLLLTLPLLLAGCRSAQPIRAAKAEVEIERPADSPASDLLDELAPGNTSVPVPTQPETLPTSVLISEAEDTLPVIQATSYATPAPDPLRFVFPTAVQEAISAWRPPLYPTPWAPTPFDHFFFSRPIAADEINWPVPTYRYGGEFFAETVHTGVDIPAPKGTPVIAAGSGKVVWAGYGVYRGGYDKSDPYGLAVTIRHDFGYQNQSLYTIYGHMDQIDVAEGQHVETGELLGLVGETGKVTGPHLHFEIRVGENNFLFTRNPELWISPPQGWGVLAGRVMDTNSRLISGQLILVTDPATGQNWLAYSYGPEAANPDPYYDENLVIGDLPAGTYQLRTSYAGMSHSAEIEILPGLVTFFKFRGWGSFSLEPPPMPGVEYTPQPVSSP